MADAYGELEELELSRAGQNPQQQQLLPESPPLSAASGGSEQQLQPQQSQAGLPRAAAARRSQLAEPLRSQDDRPPPQSPRQEPADGMVAQTPFGSSWCAAWWDYLFFHPIFRIFVTVFDPACNFWLFGEDPLAHSKTKASSPLVGEVGQLLLSQYPPGIWLLKLLWWLLWFYIGIFVGRNVVHHLILRDFFKLEMFGWKYTDADDIVPRVRRSGWFPIFRCYCPWSRENVFNRIFWWARLDDNIADAHTPYHELPEPLRPQPTSTFRDLQKQRKLHVPPGWEDREQFQGVYQDLGINPQESMCEVCCPRTCHPKKHRGATKGSWMVIGFTVIVTLYISALLWNWFLVLTFDSDFAGQWYLDEMVLGMKNSLFTQLTATGCWFILLLTMIMVVDGLLQELGRHRKALREAQVSDEVVRDVCARHRLIRPGRLRKLLDDRRASIAQGIRINESFGGADAAKNIEKVIYELVLPSRRLRMGYFNVLPRLAEVWDKPCPWLSGSVVPFSRAKVGMDVELAPMGTGMHGERHFGRIERVTEDNILVRWNTYDVPLWGPALRVRLQRGVEQKQSIDRAWWDGGNAAGEAWGRPTVRTSVRNFVIWFLLLVINTLVIVFVILGAVDWDYWAQHVNGTNEAHRLLIASLITVLDLLLILQDWDFPAFESNIAVKMPGMDLTAIDCGCCEGACGCTHYEQHDRDGNVVKKPSGERPGLPCCRVFATGKWFTYSCVILTLMMDTMMVKNQIGYAPGPAGQYVKPDDASLCTSAELQAANALACQVGMICFIPDASEAQDLSDKWTKAVEDAGSDVPIFPYEYSYHYRHDVKGIDETCVPSRYESLSVGVKFGAALPAILSVVWFCCWVCVYSGFDHQIRRREQHYRKAWLRARDAVLSTVRLQRALRPQGMREQGMVGDVHFQSLPEFQLTDGTMDVHTALAATVVSAADADITLSESMQSAAIDVGDYTSGVW